MTSIYTVAIDSAEDDSFSEHITARVLSASWQLGVTSPGEATLTLDNADGAVSGASWAGRFMRISALSGGRDEVLFTGLVTHIRPDAGAQGRRQAIVIARTADIGLSGARADLPPLVDQPADAILRALLAGSGLRRRALSQCMVIGSSAFGVLGLARIADDLPIALDAQPGISAFRYAVFDPDARADAVLAQVVSAERGLCFADRSGGLVFVNRHALLLSGTPALSLSDDMAALALEQAPAVNQASITCVPRRLGPDDTPLWTLNTPLRVPARATVTVRIAFRDEDGDAVGCADAAMLSFTARTQPAGGGLVSVAGSITDTLASGAVVSFSNPSAVTAWIQAGAQVVGTPVISDGRLRVSHEDQEAITRYGLHALSLELPLLADADEAAELARFEVGRGGDPVLSTTSVTLDLRDHPSALAVSLMDIIAISEAHTGHSAHYRVLGEAHTVDLAGTRHRLTFTLMRADDTAFWVLGSGALDARTALAI
ncbi:MAG: hypothetical protein KME04_11010 [Pleurocapsa minor GSE-CHR-MK-17-07R]|jgi:hypothetical protein|nr:hypothetical protein [Pleurocapsa minor GSE-CHR-MK 17-07R]